MRRSFGGGQGDNGGRGDSSGRGKRGNKSYRGWGRPRNKEPSISNSETLSVDEQKLKERRERFGGASATGTNAAGAGAGRRPGEYGFVSRGEDNRLQQSETERKLFFERILADFMSYCAESGSELKEKVKDLGIEGDADTQHSDNGSESGSESIDSATVLANSLNSLSIQDHKSPPPASLNSVLTSLRKLREALLFATPNEFSKRVFLFSVRISAAIGQYHTYIPSITYLLDKARALLTPLEVSEVATLLVLHLSHFNNQNLRAIELYYKYSIDDVNLLRVLNAWSSGDFHNWVKAYNRECDGSKHAIMSMGIPKVVQQIVLVLTAAYFNIEKKFLEESILPNGVDLALLVDKYNCDWKQDGALVVIRERGKRK